jgi:quinoprotein relay system zinc metallohydrolase 2
VFSSAKQPGVALRATVQWLLTTLIVCPALIAQANDQSLEFVESAPGIYLHYGKHEEMSVDNFGDIANIGFIIGTESVAVIDPGGSPRIGTAMRSAIRALTDLPISHVILTHIHPDHIFGGSAFADVENIVAHQNFSRALAQRGDFYRDGYSALFIDSNVPTTLRPTLAVADELRIELGGRSLSVRAHRTAHTDNDLSVFDNTTQTLWASDLIFAQRIPSLDGSLTGWLNVMDDLATLSAVLVIPGHGLPDSWSTVAQPQRRYLTLLLRETRKFIAQNKRLSAAVDSIAVAERENWRLFDSHHRGNVTKAYTELEWE